MNKINKVFGWYFILKSLSNDDITKLEEVSNIDFQSVINYLLILKQERRLENIKSELDKGTTTFA